MDMDTRPMSAKDDEVTVFAETDFRERRQHFGIKRKDRRHHMYIVGKTGMGKSTLLSTLIVSDLRAGNGLALIDPHGDLAEQVLACVPESRRREFIAYPPNFRAEAIAPIQNKVGQYLASPAVRQILQQSERNLDLRLVMDDGRILIANLSKGKLGEATSSLLGALLVSGLELAA